MVLSFVKPFLLLNVDFFVTVFLVYTHILTHFKVL